MASTIHTSLGFHTRSQGAFQVYFDPTYLEHRKSESQIGLVDPANGNQLLYSRADSGVRDTLWKHLNFYLPANIGVSGNGDVTLQYHYSNDEYDVLNDWDRANLLDSLSNNITDTEMRSESISTGRYRYLLLHLTTNQGKDCFVQSNGFMEDSYYTLLFTEFVPIYIDGEEAPCIVKVKRGESRTLNFDIYTTTNRTDNYDLTGGQVILAIHKSYASLESGSSLLIGPLECTIVDPELGSAYITLTHDQLDLDYGEYVAEVLVIVGTVRIKRSFTIRITPSLITASYGT
jgi:hypothetical protein